MTARLLLLSLLLAAPALALEPYLVKDINPIPEPGDSFPATFATLGSVALFAADDGRSGRELWRSDGTAAGTWQVADLCPLEGCSGDAGGFAVTDRLFFFTAHEDRGNRRTLWVTDGTSAVNLDLAVQGPPLWVPAQGVLYFSGSDGEHGFELWRTDGTLAGTWMVADLQPGAGGSAPSSLTLYKGRIWFGAVGPKGGALFSSDGTTKGTAVVKELGKTGAFDPRSLRPFHLHALGKRLVFAADAGLGHHDLWASDGTTKGTARLTQWTKGTPYSLVLAFAAQGARSYFVADDGRNGQELWVTDGTAKGTRMLTRFARSLAFYVDPYVFPDMLLIPNLTGGRLLFAAHDGSRGVELWSTDGTVQGTRFLKEVCPGECHGFGGFSIAHRGRLYFGGNDGVHGWEPWVTDGTAAGTRLVRDVCAGSCSSATGSDLIPLGDRLLWAASEDDGRTSGLWTTDGTEAGTRRVSDVSLRLSFLLGTALGGRLLFSAQGGPEGTELWITDGTDAGTALVRDIHDADLGGSHPTSLRAFGDRVLFLADDGVHGHELWKSDGTEAGTALAAELVPGEEPASAGLGSSAVAGGKLFFIQNERLWRTDGTQAGTFVLTGPHVSMCCSEQVRAAGGKVFFPVYDGEDALWVSDSTVEGTRPVGDTGNGEIQDLVEFQGKLFFTLERGTFWELWRSDGTDAGTVLVEELGSVPPSGVYQGTPYLTVHAGSLWYFASDGDGGVELRRGNGTGPGTGAAFGVKPFAVDPLGAKLLVSGTDGQVFGLWVTDGTPAGTQLVGPPSNLGPTAVFQGRLYYAVYDQSLFRTLLWTTDGTPEGTGPLRDHEGSEIDAAQDFATLGNLLLFTVEGTLWQTDGTAAGTFPIRDLGVRASGELVPVGSRVLFSSYDRATGEELWALEGEQSEP